jgi:membrane fusion protein (multidrug efflux system)
MTKSSIIKIMTNMWFFFILIIIITSCSDHKTEYNTDTVLSADVDTTNVKVTSAIIKAFNYTITAPGKIEALNQCALQFKTGGIIKNIYVRNGQKVNKHQIIAELNNDYLKIQSEKSYAQYLEKNEEFKTLFISHGGEWGKPESLSDNIAKVLKTKSGLLQAEAIYKEAQYNLESCLIKAPFSGIISNVFLKAGSFISKDEFFCTLYNPEALIVNADIIESDFGQVKMNSFVKVTAISIPDKEFKGEICEINPIVTTDGLIRVKTKINKAKEFLPGMNVIISINVLKNNNIVIPKEAIVLKGNKNIVFTVEDNIAKWNEVKTGLDNGKEIEILEGIKPNETVIIDNNLQLMHESPVRVVNTLKN